MAGISKYDLVSGSPDGSPYLNAQRGAYALEKSGSFREGADSRIVPSLPGTLRPGNALSQGDPGSMFQSLLSDLKPAGLEQKFPRAGEIKKSLYNIVGATSEDSIPATFSMRPLAREEIRRTKGNLNDCTTKARNRVKAFGEAISKIEKYSHGISRKRSRADISLGERSDTLLPGGTMPRTGAQSHLTGSGLENGPQKSDERTKSSVPNRRARTNRDAGRIDGRANGTARPSVPVDRDKDIYKHVNGSTTPPEERGRALPTGVDGWEKSKMKKKRSVIKSDTSVTASLDRSVEGDREPKPAMQQKLTSHVRPRLNNTHGLRSGPVATASGVGKSDSMSQPNCLESRPFPRNDIGNGFLPIDRRERPLFPEKDGSALKAANKSNSREDNCASSSTGTAQVNASTRGPRSNSSSLSKAIPNIHRSSGNSDDWEHPQSVSKLSASVGVMNRKRSTSTSSSSPPVAQWGGQRPQKIQRVGRRSNLTPVITGDDEISASDMADNAINEDLLAFSRRSSSNASQQSKLKGDYAPSSGLSESEESGAAENKPKDKGRKCNETDERDGSTIQKVASLVQPSRKNKVGIDEDLGEGIRRQGRNGRGLSSTRSGMPASTEKPESAQWKSARNSSEKIESKPGRPPAKKWSERKGHTRPRHSMNNNTPNDFTGEPDDDHEELLAAAKAALDAGKACPSSFWKQLETVFGFLSTEDLAFLNKQSHITDDAVASSCVSEGCRNLKIDLGCISLPSSPSLASRDDCGSISNGFWLDDHDRDMLLVNQANNVEPFPEHLVQKNEAPNQGSLCQALLSAIIMEEEVGGFGYVGEHSFDETDAICFEFDEELTPKVSNTISLGTFQGPERVPSNGYRINSGGRYHAELSYQNLGNNDFSLEQNVEGNALDELVLNQKFSCISTFSELQYNQMSIDDRILQEMNAIGVYPEPVPELAQSEDEEVGKGIGILEEKLHEVALKKRGLLSKLEKTVAEARKLQQSELKRIAFDKLVEIAYKKYMDSWGTNKTAKHAALAFVRRTLARFQQFVETRSSCFDEPAFRDMFLCVSSCTHGIDIAADGEAANSLVPTSDYNSSLAPQSAQKVDIHDSFRSLNHLSEQVTTREDPWSHKARKKELMLDDVVGGTSLSSLRSPSGIGSSLISGAKGKRSERERDGKGQNRDAVSRNSTAKNGQPISSNVKGERKNKTKPKQKTTQLSTSVNGLKSKATEVSNILTATLKSQETTVVGSAKKDGIIPSQPGMQNLSNEAEALDFCDLQLPELDGDFNGNGQDISSWLNIDEEGMQDDDYMGLEIPMDDLSEVNMMI